jgi:hypothetical protein
MKTWCSQERLYARLVCTCRIHFKLTHLSVSSTQLLRGRRFLLFSCTAQSPAVVAIALYSSNMVIDSLSLYFSSNQESTMSASQKFSIPIEDIRCSTYILVLDCRWLLSFRFLCHGQPIDMCRSIKLPSGYNWEIQNKKYYPIWWYAKTQIITRIHHWGRKGERGNSTQSH